MKRQDGDKSESSAKAQKLDDASSLDKPCKAEDKAAVVEVRYLSGDSHFIDGCSNVGDVMVHVAKQAGRFASEVAVTATDSGKILGRFDASPPLVSVILRGNVALSGDELLTSLLLHAGRGDCATCFRLVSILQERGLLDRVLMRPVPDGEEWEVSPLVAAARLGYADVVKTLLEAGASVDCDVGGLFDSSGTALEAAAEQGHKDVVVALLEAGASIDLAIGHGGTALMAATEARQEDIVKFLLEKGADADVADFSYQNPLIVASENGDVNIVEILLAAGACVNFAEVEVHTPLMLAAENGHIRVVEALLSAGAKLDVVCCCCCETALAKAKDYGHKEVTQILLAAGARAREDIFPLQE